MLTAKAVCLRLVYQKIQINGKKLVKSIFAWDKNQFSMCMHLESQKIHLIANRIHQTIFFKYNELALSSCDNIYFMAHFLMNMLQSVRD